MGREVMFATFNPHKKERFQAYFQPLGLEVVGFADIKNKIEVVEDGRTPEENALKKARAGYLATGKPTFGVDYWLRINGFPEEIQPGPYVRRIFVKGGKRVEASDEEMLEYYMDKIQALGGRATATWTSAIALVVGPDKEFTESFTGDSIMTSERSSNETEGEPLNSLQIDPKSGKYFTDLTMEEWLNLQKEREGGYVKFMERHLQEIK